MLTKPVVSQIAKTEFSEQPKNQQIKLNNYINISTVTVVDWSPNCYIIPKPGVDINSIFSALQNAHPNMTAYLKADIPAFYQYTNNV